MEAKLPQFFDIKAVEKKRVPNQKYCNLCEIEFDFRNPVRHCKMCAKSVCKVCSDVRR